VASSSRFEGLTDGDDVDHASAAVESGEDLFGGITAAKLRHGLGAGAIAGHFEGETHRVIDRPGASGSGLPPTPPGTAEAARRSKEKPSSLSTEQAEEQGSAEAPGSVDEKAGCERAGLPTADGLVLERSDDEPGHERGRERAEDDALDEKPHEASTPREQKDEDDSPDASPEGERDDLRHAERPGQLDGKGGARRDPQSVKQSQHPLVKHECGKEAGEKRPEQTHGPPACRMRARQR
jgi:hypothetical protein